VSEPVLRSLLEFHQSTAEPLCRVFAYALPSEVRL